VTVYYRWHPLFGQSVRVHRRHRIKSEDYLHIRLPDETTCGLPAWMFDSACLEFIIGDPLISVEALNELRDVLNTLHGDAGKCDKPLLNIFRKGDTHESSGKLAPAAKPQVDECIADGDSRREKRRIASGDHGSTSRGGRERRRPEIGAKRES
jgi:hypothetical protein